MKRTVMAVVVFFLLILTFLFAPFKIQWKIKTMGKILPAREMNLIKVQGDRIAFVVNDYTRGVSSEYRVINFERGDAVNFKLNEGLRIGAVIQEGEVIGSLISGESEYQLERLKGLLDVELANLKIYKSGEKESVVEQAKAQLSYAVEQARLQEKIFERMKSLYEKNFVSKQEFEIAENTARLAQISVRIAETQVQILETGAKPEQIELIEKRVKSLQREIKSLENKIKQFKILAPFKAIIYKISSGDTMLIAGDTSEFVVLMPLKISDKDFINLGADANLHTYFGEIYKAKIFAVENTVRLINNSQQMIALALIDGSSDGIIPGMFAEIEIEAGELSLQEYLKRLIKSLFQR